MVAPGDDHERIVEQRFLDDVVHRRRIAQRTDQHVDVAVAQALQEIVAGSVDHADPDSRMDGRQRVDRDGQDVRPGQRQGSDHDCAGLATLRCIVADERRAAGLSRIRAVHLRESGSPCPRLRRPARDAALDNDRRVGCPTGVRDAPTFARPGRTRRWYRHAPVPVPGTPYRLLREANRLFRRMPDDGRTSRRSSMKAIQVPAVRTMMEPLDPDRQAKGVGTRVGCLG